MYVLCIINIFFFQGMLTGLKKIVGKNSSPNGQDTTESRLLDVESTQPLFTPSLKTGKKRKVADSTDSFEIKRKYVFLIHNNLFFHVLCALLFLFLC